MFCLINLFINFFLLIGLKYICWYFEWIVFKICLGFVDNKIVIVLFGGFLRNFKILFFFWIVNFLKFLMMYILFVFFIGSWFIWCISCLICFFLIVFLVVDIYIKFGWLYVLIFVLYWLFVWYKISLVKLIVICFIVCVLLFLNK